jgi:NADPH-dependent curcumin reductase CurA
LKVIGCGAAIYQAADNEGLIVRDWLDRQDEFEKEVDNYLQSGKLKNKETMVEGIELAVGAFIGLFAGKNIIKMIVRLV